MTAKPPTIVQIAWQKKVKCSFLFGSLMIAVKFYLQTRTNCLCIAETNHKNKKKKCMMRKGTQKMP